MLYKNGERISLLFNPLCAWTFSPLRIFVDERNQCEANYRRLYDGFASEMVNGASIGLIAVTLPGKSPPGTDVHDPFIK